MNPSVRIGSACAVAVFVSACGGVGEKNGGPLTFDGNYVSTTLFADGFTHVDRSTVSGGTASGNHTFSNGTASGSFSWTATVTPNQDSTRAALSGNGIINNLGTRAFTLTGSIDRASDGNPQLCWSGNDPMFGAIGGCGERPAP
jgi:hypothetical protein